jgi:4-amino-4-deoxy-L-arabinose transferase-like glycosyltransferase
MNKTKILLFIILFIGFVLRLYRFDGPLADWHSWRQAETSMVSRNFVNDGFDLLHPRMDNISNVQSGGAMVDNPHGYFFVEFPLYNAAQAGLFKLFGIFTLEAWGRLVSIFASTLAALFLYLIVSRHSNKTLGLLSAAFYAFIPFNIYYGRIILPDSSMVMAILGGIYFFDRWIEQNKNLLFFVLALLFTTSALLLKPVAVFFVLPMLYLAWKKFGWKIVINWQLWLFAIVSVAPLIWWRMWMLQFPEGIPHSQWLLNGNGIRFRPSFFRWILYERLTKLLLGYMGIGIFLYGLWSVRKIKEWMFFVSFLLSSLIYVCVVATGSVQHDYYQIPVMPGVAIFCAFGSYYLYQWTVKKLPIGKMVVIVLIIGGYYFSLMQVRDFFNINNRSMIAAGEAVDRLIPKDAMVIANLEGDSTFLYHTKRKGWASFQNDMPTMIQKGASYLVLLNPTEQDHAFAKDYKIVSETKEYILFDLKSTNR